VFKTDDDTVVWVGKDGTKIRVYKKDSLNDEQWKNLVEGEDIIGLENGKIVIKNNDEEEDPTENLVFLTSEENNENDDEEAGNNTLVGGLAFGNKSIVEYDFNKDTLETEVKIYEGEVTVYELDFTNFSKKTLISLKPGESLKVSLIDYAEIGDEALKKGTFDINEKNEGVEKIKRIKKRANRPVWPLLVGGIVILVVLVVGTFLKKKK